MGRMNAPLWLVYALLGALCASMINVLGKIGMTGVDSDLATAVRSAVQALFVIGFCAMTGALGKLDTLGVKPMTMIVLSGICGGLSWIFVFRAIQIGEVSRVAPIDKLSLPLGIILAVLVLKERPIPVNWLGIGLIVAGAYLATIKPTT